MLRGFGWIEEVSSGDKEKAWKTLANLGAVDWLEGMLTPVYDRGLSESQARKVWLAIAAMSAYALSTADSVRMRQEVVSGGNGMYAMVSVKKYLMTAVKIYQHQIGSRLRPVAPAYGSTFSFGRIRSEPPQMTADEIAPMVLSVEEISGLRAQGYSMLDEDAWNRLTTLLRTIRLNEGRIDDVAGLRQRILGATPEELASKALDDLVMESIHMRPVA